MNCKTCKDEGIVTINPSIPIGKDGRYGICPDCSNDDIKIIDGEINKENTISSQFKIIKNENV